MCLSADWAGMLALSNSLCIVLCCVFGFVALSRASALALFCRPCFGWSVASVLPVWFSFRGAAGLLSFAAAVRCLWLVAVFVCLFCLCVLGACGLARSLLVSPFPPHPPLVSPLCLLVQSVLCWSLPPGIWLYLQRSGCHTFDMACCG